MVDDVCGPIFGQFPVTVRHVVEIIGERQSPEIELTRRALWGMLTEVIGGPFTENLRKCLSAHLEGRRPHWEGRAMQPRPVTMASDGDRVDLRAEAFHQGEHESPAETDAPQATAERAATSEPASVSKPDKGNLEILRGLGGELKRAVNLDVARRFGGVTRRAIEDAAHKGWLETEGKRQNRRVLVQSLVKYFPQDK